jgi:hypothetical protein
MKIAMLVMISILTSSTVFSKGKRKEKIVYKQRQVIDLGALEIDGELVTPGDFSINNEKERASELLYKRKNYNDRLRINIEYVF